MQLAYLLLNVWSQAAGPSNRGERPAAAKMAVNILPDSRAIDFNYKSRATRFIYI